MFLFHLSKTTLVFDISRSETKFGDKNKIFALFKYVTSLKVRNKVLVVDYQTPQHVNTVMWSLNQSLFYIITVRLKPHGISSTLSRCTWRGTWPSKFTWGYVDQWPVIMYRLHFMHNKPNNCPPNINVKQTIKAPWDNCTIF